MSVLIQMHGHPGSGKSAFARALGAAVRNAAFTPGKGFCSPDSCVAGEGSVRREAVVAR